MKVNYFNHITEEVFPLADGAHTISEGDLISVGGDGYAKQAGDTSGDKFIGIALENKTIAAANNTADGKHSIRVLPARAGNIVKMSFNASTAITTGLPGVTVYAKSATTVATSTTNSVVVGTIQKWLSTTEAYVAI